MLLGVLGVDLDISGQVEFSVLVRASFRGPFVERVAEAAFIHTIA